MAAWQKAPMLHPTLLAAGAVAAVVSVVYAYVARLVAQRRGASAGAERAMRLFALWWACLAANIGMGAMMYLAAGLGYTDFHVQLTYALLQRLLLAVAMLGLMSYLLFLLTGRGFLAPLAAIYLGYYVFQVYTVFAGEPSGVLVAHWRTDLAYAATLPPVFGLVNLVWVVAPPVVGALLYFRLFFRLRNPTQRYRVALISWSIVVWWVVAVVAGQREAIGQDAFQVVNRLVGLGAALAIALAFQPPGWVTRRWSVRPFPETGEAAPAPAVRGPGDPPTPTGAPR